MIVGKRDFCAIHDFPTTEERIIIERFQIEIVRSGIHDRIFISKERDGLVDRVKIACPDQPAIRLRPLKVGLGCGFIRIGNFNAIETMLKPCIAAFLDHRTIAIDRHRRFEFDDELTLLSEIVFQRADDRIARIIHGHPVEPKSKRSLDTLRRIHASKGRFDQQSRILKRTQFLEPRFQNHRVAITGGRNSAGQRSRLDRRAKIARRADRVDSGREHGRLFVFWQIDEESIRPHPSLVQGDFDLTARDFGFGNLKTERFISRNRRHSGSERITRGTLLPFAHDVGLRVPIPIEQDTALLVERATKIARCVFIPCRKIASHSCLL